MDIQKTRRDGIMLYSAQPGFRDTIDLNSSSSSSSKEYGIKRN